MKNLQPLGPLLTIDPRVMRSDFEKYIDFTGQREAFEKFKAIN